MKTSKLPPRIIFSALCAFLCAFAWNARAQVNVTIGTLQPGESVTITYDVTIDNPIAPGTTQISSQGTVSGSNFSPINTDDPETTAANDATVTPLSTPPTLDLNGASAGNDVTVHFTEQIAELICPSGTITDTENDPVVSLTATLTSRPNGDGVESLALNSSATNAVFVAGLTASYTSGTGVLLITGSASLGTYQTILQGILYSNISENPTTTSRSVTVVVSDGNPSVTQTSTITVSEVNDPPIVGTDTLTPVDEDSGPRTIPISSLLANDVPGPAAESAQTVSFVSAGNPTHGTVQVSGTDVIFTPDPDYNGMVFFQYVIQDDGTTAGVADPRTASGFVQFQVYPVTEVTAITSATTPEDTQTTSGLVLTPTGQEAPVVSHYKITGITGGILFQNDGTSPILDGDFITRAQGAAGLKFTPAANRNSAAGDIFTFNAQSATNSTGGALGPLSPASITVTPVADTPSVTGATTAEDTQTSSGLVISRNPVDGAEVTHFKISGIAGGSLFKHDGTTQIANGGFITFAEGNAGLKFTPGANLNSPSTTFGFTVQASTAAGDSGVGGATVTANITVTAVNDNPVAVDDTILRSLNGDAKVLVATLLANDTDAENDTISFTGVNSPSTGGATVTFSGAWVYYRHNGTTADTFTYTISDGHGGTASGTVHVNIQNPDTQAGPALTATVDGSGAHVTFEAVAGKIYTMQHATDPGGPWTDQAAATESSPGHYTYTDATTTTGTHYYRAVFR